MRVVTAAVAIMYTARIQTQMNITSVQRSTVLTFTQKLTHTYIKNRENKYQQQHQPVVRAHDDTKSHGRYSENGRARIGGRNEYILTIRLFDSHIDTWFVCNFECSNDEDDVNSNNTTQRWHWGWKMSVCACINTHSSFLLLHTLIHVHTWTQWNRVYHNLAQMFIQDTEDLAKFSRLLLLLLLNSACVCVFVCTRFDLEKILPYVVSAAFRQEKHRKIFHVIVAVAAFFPHSLAKVFDRTILTKNFSFVSIQWAQYNVIYSTVKISHVYPFEFS